MGAIHPLKFNNVLPPERFKQNFMILNALLDVLRVEPRNGELR
jgi:hypothetical protein